MEQLYGLTGGQVITSLLINSAFIADYSCSYCWFYSLFWKKGCNIRISLSVCLLEISGTSSEKFWSRKRNKFWFLYLLTSSIFFAKKYVFLDMGMNKTTQNIIYHSISKHQIQSQLSIAIISTFLNVKIRIFSKSTLCFGITGPGSGPKKGHFAVLYPQIPK